mmetsp:Transcript_80593/g.261182  ORF Transcript_80593/g.261182 Transcript_80593/m.261182 type:complete len:235 (-) Transcript_80593:51-755(-)
MPPISAPRPWPSATAAWPTTAEAALSATRKPRRSALKALRRAAFFRPQAEADCTSPDRLGSSSGPSSRCRQSSSLASRPALTALVRRPRPCRALRAEASRSSSPSAAKAICRAPEGAAATRLAPQSGQRVAAVRFSHKARQPRQKRWSQALLTGRCSSSSQRPQRRPPSGGSSRAPAVAAAPASPSGQARSPRPSLPDDPDSESAPSSATRSGGPERAGLPAPGLHSAGCVAAT